MSPEKAVPIHELIPGKRYRYRNVPHCGSWIFTRSVQQAYGWWVFEEKGGFTTHNADGTDPWDGSGDIVKCLDEDYGGKPMPRTLADIDKEIEALQAERDALSLECPMEGERVFIGWKGNDRGTIQVTKGGAGRFWPRVAEVELRVIRHDVKGDQ